MGLDFVGTNGQPHGPDLLRTVRSLSRESLPKDIRDECFDAIREDERPRPGDWIAIWGGEQLDFSEETVLTKQDLPQRVVVPYSWRNLLGLKSLPSLMLREAESIC